MKPRNIYSNIPADSAGEVFELLAHNDHVKVERIISGVQHSPASGWYDQHNDEWVIVLKGSASIEFKDESVVELKEGDYINIRARVKHRVISTDNLTETVWLAVHY